jgi:HSP20 family molecular chaperone IbpA
MGGENMSQEVIRKETKTVPRFAPNTDIIEREDGFYIYMDLPGVSKDDLRVDLKENELQVSGRSICPKRENVNNIHLEFGDSEYVRNFTISDIVDRQNIRATLKKGVLELFLPKAEKAKPRKIEIQAE